MSGKIIVIVAPSGTGKSTLIKRLKIEVEALLESVSYTTRNPRDGEIDGVHYNFIKKENFETMISKDEFLEWANVHGNYYGTSKSFVETQLAMGKNLLFDLDVQGTDSFKTYFGKRANVIFIAPPSVDVLKERLLGRGTETEESLKTRLNNALLELKRKDDFDFCVINDELERAYKDLKHIVKGILN